MASYLMEMISGIVHSTWRYASSGITDPLMQAKDAQSVILAIFILTLLFLTIACLINNLLGGWEPEVLHQSGRGGAKRRYGSHSHGNAVDRNNDVAFKCQSHHDGVERSRHRSKCSTTVSMIMIHQSFH